MSSCVFRLPHHCGTRQGLQVFEQEDGSLDGYCFSCRTVVKDPLGEGKTIDDIPVGERLGKSREEVEEEMLEIANLKAVSIRSRRLHKDSLEAFGVKVGLSLQDGKTPQIAYLPFYNLEGNLTHYKVRLLDQKKMWTLGDARNPNFFGWKEAVRQGSKHLIITEGEFDAVALHRIFHMHEKEEFKGTIPAIISLPSGVSHAKNVVAKMLPEIRKYWDLSCVALCFDNDEAGQKALEEVCKVSPLFKVINLPEKDANECILKGSTKAAYQAAKWNAEVKKNTSLVSLDEVWEQSKEPASYGVSWPWDGVTKLTRGIRTGETIYLGAAQKMGKSEVVNALAAHLVAVHQWKILLAKPEEANVKTAKLLAGKIAKARFHDPDAPFDEEAFERAGETLLGDKVYMLNLYQHLGWESLKDDIIAAAALGVKAVFLDPITNLTNGMNAADANTKLQEVAQELAAMAKDLDIVVFIFCHLRNPEGGPPHDRGGKVLTSQFAGSRAMGRSCNYMFGLEGNKDPELDEYERNMRTLVLLDDREFGEVGEIKLYWDKKTTIFQEVRA